MIAIDRTLLPRISLLGGLSDDDQALVWGLLEERAYEAGAVVVEEGTAGRELFIVAEGTVEIAKRGGDGATCRLAELGPGDCFGEMALVGIMRRTATVRAGSALRVLVLAWPQIAALSGSHLAVFSMLVMNLARDLCRRLQAANARLAEAGVPVSEA